jgi:hypothetical protein
MTARGYHSYRPFVGDGNGVPLASSNLQTALHIQHTFKTRRSNK